jgi:hypothetical protein
MTHVFDPTNVQLADITKYADALTQIDIALEQNLTTERGEGYRAVLFDPIPIYSDARGERELLGWLKPSDFNWVYTQKADSE